MSLVETIRALLAHAASAAGLGNQAEAELYESKALELMTRHVIDRALVDAKQPTHRRVDTFEIDGQELPQTYQSAHAVGILSLVCLLGGDGLWFYKYGSSKVESIRIAIDDPQAFRHLVLGLAAIAAATVATLDGDRGYCGNWVRGFWSGCRAEASAQIAADDRSQDLSKALAVTRQSARASLAIPDGFTARPYKPPSPSWGWLSGRQAGQETYRSFGKAVQAHSATAPTDMARAVGVS